MLKEIEIKNFQSHSYIRVRLSEGVNTITGSSEAGKSAMVRAIRWVVLNRPAGNSIIKKGEKRTSVILTFDNGYISKSRTKTETIYDVNGTILKAVGRDIPEELNDLSKLTDINFQMQHSPFFLLKDTPGEIAKQMNELVGLTIIDSLFNSINNGIRKAKGDIVSLRENLEGLNTDLHNLQYIDSAYKTLKKFENALISKERTEDVYKNLCSIRSDLKEIEEVEKEVKEILASSKIIRSMEKSIRDYQLIKEQLYYLKRYKKTIRDIDNETEEGKKKLKKLQEHKGEIMRDIKECPLCGTIIKKGNKHEAHN